MSAVSQGFFHYFLENFTIAILSQGIDQLIHRKHSA